MNTQGNLYIIAAASGTGKTSLADALIKTVENIKLSISHTTRTIRAGEEPDKHYFFTSAENFESLIQQNAFLEYAKVFDGCYYGTSMNWVTEQLNSGIDVLLDIDWQGAQQIRAKMKCVSIFLLPPSRAELRARLEKRKREDAKTIANRLAKASSEIAHCQEFDYIVINDKFETALADLQSIIRSNRLQCKRQMKKYDILIGELL